MPVLIVEWLAAAAAGLIRVKLAVLGLTLLIWVAKIIHRSIEGGRK